MYLLKKFRFAQSSEGVLAEPRLPEEGVAYDKAWLDYAPVRGAFERVPASKEPKRIVTG